MPDLLPRMQDEVLVVDGAMGTMLQRAGVAAGECPEHLNVTAPDVVVGIHRNYVMAGADCITTNTFGANRPKLAKYGLEDQVEGINREGVRLARRAGAVHVLGDVGPTGLVMEPLGEVGFDEAFEYFSEQVAALAGAGVDAILIETMTDIAEARCALLAARETCDLPVFVTMTFDASGRTDLSATPPEAAAVILEACGASAIGVNCGLGPEQMLPIVEALASATSLALIAQPNAGLPRVEEGETVFPGTPDEMAAFAARAAGAGAVLLGSCCGSTPAFTGAIADTVKGSRPVKRARPEGLAIAGPRKVVRMGRGLPLVVVGERINPTGRPRLAASLAEGSVSEALELALAQESEGADALDVNVGAADVDERRMLPAVVKALSAAVSVPLVIDNTDPEAVEEALKVYPGRALLNSVNASPASIEALLPLAKRYGAAVLILALDEDGVPKDAESRLAAAQKVRSAAHAAGLSDRDLAVDCLVMTAATDPGAARVTLDAVREVSQSWGLPTLLGVSNISHGLPGRAALNAAFLALAEEAGLSAAIMDPASPGAVEMEAAVELLMGRDPEARGWIALFEGAGADRAGVSTDGGVGPQAGSAGDVTPAEALVKAVLTGDVQAAPRLVDDVVASGIGAGDVVEKVLSPAIQSLGEAFSRGEVFLPQLMVAAEAMKAAVGRVRELLPDAAGSVRGRVVFGTVRGDVHSIGKDVCISMLESAGFAVTDLGVDVPADSFLEAGREADVTCLSALMTTTLPSMEETARELAGAGLPVVVGGAVVTESFASRIGARYADDAPGCVEVVSSLVEGSAPR
ncbi:MAG: homocysteine S-methyltransferase family protein [Coriobacteriia bacterium]